MPVCQSWGAAGESRAPLSRAPLLLLPLLQIAATPSNRAVTAPKAANTRRRAGRHDEAATAHPLGWRSRAAHDPQPLPYRSAVPAIRGSLRRPLALPK